jgi:hypothetical protein
MITIYYLGGPWDLHKVGSQRQPNGDKEIIRGLKVLSGAKPTDPVETVDHTYILRPVARDVFVAMYEDLVR